MQLKDELQKIKDSKSESPAPYVNVDVGKENVCVVNSQQVAAPAKSIDSNTSSHQGAASADTSHQRSAFHNEQLRELQQKMILAHQELSRAKEALLGMYTALR